MAGIEKVCEYSGVSDGWIMYQWKSHHIQVNPKYRALFRKSQHTLYVTENGVRYVNKRYGVSQDWSEHTNYENLTEQEWMDWKGYRKEVQWEYMLVVSDPELFGEVDGVYLNWSRRIGTVKRKLKRMLKVALHVVHVDGDEFDDLYQTIRHARSNHNG